MVAKRPILKMNNFDKGDRIMMKANEKETHYQGYAVYFKKHVTSVNAQGVLWPNEHYNLSLNAYLLCRIVGITQQKIIKILKNVIPYL